MIDKLPNNLEWHSATSAEDNLPMHNERVLAVFTERDWMTMVTFHNDESGTDWVCHSMKAGAGVQAGTIIALGDEEVCWTRFTQKALQTTSATSHNRPVVLG